MTVLLFLLFIIYIYFLNSGQLIFHTLGLWVQYWHRCWRISAALPVPTPPSDPDPDPPRTLLLWFPLCVSGSDRRLISAPQLFCFVHKKLWVKKRIKPHHVFENYILHACKEWFIIFFKEKTVCTVVLWSPQLFFFLCGVLVEAFTERWL